MEIKNEILWRIYAVMLLIVVMALLIFGKAAKVQIIEGEKWKEEADSLQLEYRPTMAERGNIMAYDGRLLATSLPLFKLSMDTRSDGMSDELFDANVDSLGFYLSQYIDNTFSPQDFTIYLKRARADSVRYLQIKKNLSYQEVELVKTFPLFKLGQYKGGLIIERMNKRQRPFRMLAHRTIGYVREQSQPVGLEGAFDKVLRGEAGKQLMQRVTGNVWIPVSDLSSIEPESGHDIITTLDVNIQDIVGNALLKALKTHNADHGCAVVMEVKTGAIRAIANIGKSKSGSYWELYNYAIGEATEPGSTFKLATIMALLEDKFIELTDSVDLEQGKANFYEETMIDAALHGLDSTSIQRAFELSSNVGIAKLVDKHYNQPRKGDMFIKRLKEFHLHEKTKIEIAGEGQPFIKEAYQSDWSGTTLPWMAQGYEVLLTPLQTLTFYNAVANGGRMMKPYLVSELRDYGKTYEQFTPIAIDKKIASTETITKVQSLLRGVVENGTAKNIKTDAYAIAGKTGTAQINYRRLRSAGEMKYQSSFVGYFPADAPVYSCIVVINDPQVGGFYGSEVAAPVFREIADMCYARLTNYQPPINKEKVEKWERNALPNENAGFKQDIKQCLAFLGIAFKDEDETSRWAVVKAGNNNKVALSPIKGFQRGIVPDVIGMGARDATHCMRYAGYEVRIVGIGKVQMQSIAPKTPVGVGRIITLILG